MVNEPKPISEYTPAEKKAVNRLANPEMTDAEFEAHWESVQEIYEKMKTPSVEVEDGA